MPTSLFSRGSRFFGKGFAIGHMPDTKKAKVLSLANLFDFMARPKRFELLTPRFVVWCSIQLSYGRVLRIAREVFPREQICRERAFSYRLQPTLASLPG
jgi:hypothetical protein